VGVAGSIPVVTTKKGLGLYPNPFFIAY